MSMGARNPEGQWKIIYNARPERYACGTLDWRSSTSGISDNQKTVEICTECPLHVGHRERGVSTSCALRCRYRAAEFHLHSVESIQMYTLFPPVHEVAGVGSLKHHHMVRSIVMSYSGNGATRREVSVSRMRRKVRSSLRRPDRPFDLVADMELH